MNRYPLPADERLEQLIREAFDQIPGPDMRRISQLESRLARMAHTGRARPKLNTLPWWIVLLLAGGIVAAAWWAGELLLSGPDSVRQMQSVPVEQAEDNAPDVDASAGSTGQTTPSGSDDTGDESPVIYQREAL